MKKTLLQKKPIRVAWLLSGIGMITLEAEKQLADKDTYEEVCNDPGPLISTIHKALEKIRKRDNLNAETMFYGEKPKICWFLLAPQNS